MPAGAERGFEEKMRAKTPILALMISLSVLMFLPSEISVPAVFGAQQSGNTRWSPFGPQEQQMIISVYGDFQAMFNAFSLGQVDITDWPILPANLGSGSSSAYCDSAFNPSYFCTTPTGELGIFDLQVNSGTAFMGIPLTTSRTTSPASITAVSTTAACDSAHDSFSITLQNQEVANAVVKDAFNTLTVANQPSGSPSTTVSDSGGATPNGVYNTPCLIAGTYKITSSIYGGSATISTTGGLNHAIVFHVNWNSISSVNNAPARSLMGAAIGHTLDVPTFVSGFFGAAATSDNIMAPPAQGLTQPTSAQLSAADCNTGGVSGLHSWASACTGGSPDTSAYNLVSDSISGGTLWWQVTGSGITPGVGYSGHADLRAACDDFVAMGLTVGGPSGSNCENVANALANATLPAPYTPSNYPHVVPNGHIIFYVRTSPGRKQFGTIMTDTLNAIFGTPSSAGGGTVCYGVCPNSTPNYYTIGQIAGIIFGDGPVSAGGNGPNGWQLYTGGFSLASTPDHLYGLFNSEFSGGTCGGIPESQPNDYVLYCNPQFDTDSSAGEFSTATTFGALFSRTALDGLNTAMDVPVYSQISSFVELNGWNFQQCTGTQCVNTQSSIVNTLGGGAFAGAAYWTLLNAHQVPGYNPCSVSNPPSNCGQYAPGGGDPSLIRRGFSQTVLNLSPFTATTPWESEIVTEIFDSMLQLNPLTGGGNGQLIDWQTTSHSSSYNPNEVSCNPANGCVTGTTTQIWHLRNDLFFQDGIPVTANDVAYSLLAYRDANSALFGYALSTVSSAAGLDCNSGQACKTLQVKLQQQSPFYELDIGTEPIIPEHIWEPLCGPIVNNSIPSGPTSQCANLSFDPMAQGIMIGDGPWQCVVPAGFPNAGHIGGPCTEDANNNLAGQSVDIGGRILLTRNDGFARCCPGDVTSSLYKISYADKNNDGVVNIQDLASAAFVFGKPDPYWVNSNIAPGTTVNIQDLATVAFYFGHGITYPYLPSQLTGVDPQIDPFFCPNTGC